MRKVSLFAILIIILTPGKTQMIVDKHIDFNGKTAVEMNIQIADSIEIHTWNKNEVSLKASVNINDNKDNEGYEITLNEQGESLIVDAEFKDDYFRNDHNNCIESIIVWELYIPENTEVTVESINGNIIIGGLTGSIRAKSISGFIDWTANNESSVRLQLKSVTGKFWSNLNMEAGQKVKSFPPEFSGTINNGKYPVDLETISGDIFCRLSE